MAAAEKVLLDAVRGKLAIDSARQTLDDYLDHGMKHPEWRRMCSFVLNAELRHRKFIGSILDHLCRKKPDAEVWALLSLALATMLYSDNLRPEKAADVAVGVTPWKAKGFVNAVLRRALEGIRGGVFREKTDAQSVLPDALYRRWSKQFSAAELDGFAAGFLYPADFTFRSLFQPLSAEQCIALEAEKIERTSGRWHFYVSKNPEKVLNSELLAQGRIYVQDPATSAALDLLLEDGPARFMKVLDMCAAPGGKSLMLRELVGEDALLYAYDNSEKRRELLRENFRRCRMSDSHNFILDRLPDDRDFDLILLDVPCTNTGVFRRRPDALWRWSEQSLAETAAIQKELLNQAAVMLKPGGTLLYSTCSLEPEENRLQADELIRNHLDFKLLNSVLLLPSAGHDGAFGSRVKGTDQ